MQIELFNDLKCSIKDKYLLDKILHDFQFSDKVLEIAKPKIIFLLRDPESTIKSIINMGYITGIEWYKDPLQASNYYCTRLQQLENLAQQTEGNYFFIESAELIDNAEYILEHLTLWLNLDKPLDKKYSVFHNTGKTGCSGGDPSDNIKSGVLKKNKRLSRYNTPTEYFAYSRVFLRTMQAYLIKRATQIQIAASSPNYYLFHEAHSFYLE